MSEALDNQGEILAIELACVADVGKTIVEGTYTLEGDSYLSAVAYRVIHLIPSNLSMLHECMVRDDDSILLHLPNTRAVIRSIFRKQERIAIFCMWKRYCSQWWCTTLIVSTKKPAVWGISCPYSSVSRCSIHMDFLREALPQKILVNLIHLYPSGAAWMRWLLNVPNIHTQVKSSVDILAWFCRQKDVIPSWYHFSCIAALMQPSSAASERVFSIINRISKQRMSRMLHDYTETSVMLRYRAKFGEKNSC